MENKNFDKQFGIDPQESCLIRGNGKNSPSNIDWEILIESALNNKTPEERQTDLGFINDQIRKSQ